MFVQRQIRHEALQARVLIRQLAQLPEPCDTQVCITLLPDIQIRLAAAELSAYIRNRYTRVDLSQRIRNLLVGKP
jgi:hypothetical protein